VVGDRRKYLSALVTVDEETVTEYADANGIPYNSIDDLINNEQIYKLIEAEIQEKNKSLPSFETIKRFKIVPEFTIENKMMTPTMKIKKAIAMDTYKDEIEDMYQ